MRMVSPVGTQRRLPAVVRGWARLAAAIVVGVALGWLL